MPLAPGESRRVRFRLDPSQLALVDRSLRLRVEPGRVEVRVGASAEDLRLEGAFTIEGEPRLLGPGELRPTAVEID